jgi:hypothetical protein
MKFVKLSQNFEIYALNVRSVTPGNAHIFIYSMDELKPKRKECAIVFQKPLKFKF